MRTIKILTTAILLLFAASGCKKEKSMTAKKTISFATAIVAKWELRIQRGGFITDKNFAAGNGNVVQFNSDGTYKFYVSDAVSAQGTYEIKTLLPTGTDVLSYIYYDHAADGEVLDIKNDTLTIGTSAADALSSVYVKL